MADERGVIVLGLLFVSVFQCITASSLIPLIGWSNSDVLRSVKVSDNVEANAVAERLHLDSVDAVVVFRTTELSFDDIVKFGGSFGGSNAMFGHVEKGVEQSVSSLWTGVTGDFVRALSLHMGMSAQTLTDKATSKLLLVELEGFGDSKVGAVMNQLESKKTSYVAFYTSSQPSNSRRARAAGSDPSTESPCMPGYGQVFSGAGKTCMLFCLTKPMILDIKNGTNTTRVNATFNTPNFYNNATNIANNSTNTTNWNVPATVNQCNVSATSDNLNLQSSPTIGFNVSNTNDSSIVPYLNFVFVFPINAGTTNLAYKYFWTMAVCVSGTYQGSSFYTVLSRAVSSDNPDNELYVPQTNSYACSSSQYSTYTSALTDNDPKKLLNITSLWSNCGFSVPPPVNGTIYSNGNLNLTFFSLNIAGIQVQPYIVLQDSAQSSNSFDTPYNCEGYFSIPILMGIFSVVILLIILYCGNVFMFSIRTLDRFDDPRAPSISVDRLH